MATPLPSTDSKLRAVRTPCGPDWRWLGSCRFWTAAIAAFTAAGLLSGWLLGLFQPLGLSGPPRPQPTTGELLLSALIVLLFSASVGLIMLRRKEGACPAGCRGGTGIAGALGTVALFCPVCTILPIGMAGFSLSLSFLTPYLPLLRIIALLMLVMNIAVLLPHKN